MSNELRKFLEGLSDESANKIWAWLDEHPNAVEDMIKVISDSHPSLN